MYRSILIPLVAAVILLAFGMPPSGYAQAQNTAERMGGGVGAKTPGAARTTTVKSSKSNTSDRMGGGGGKSKNPARAINLNSSRSN